MIGDEKYKEDHKLVTIHDEREDALQKGVGQNELQEELYDAGLLGSGDSNYEADLSIDHSNTFYNRKLQKRLSLFSFLQRIRSSQKKREAVIASMLAGTVVNQDDVRIVGKSEIGRERSLKQDVQRQKMTHIAMKLSSRFKYARATLLSSRFIKVANAARIAAGQRQSAVTNAAPTSAVVMAKMVAEQPSHSIAASKSAAPTLTVGVSASKAVARDSAVAKVDHIVNAPVKEVSSLKMAPKTVSHGISASISVKPYIGLRYATVPAAVPTTKVSIGANISAPLNRPISNDHGHAMGSGPSAHNSGGMSVVIVAHQVQAFVRVTPNSIGFGIRERIAEISQHGTRLTEVTAIAGICGHNAGHGQRN